MNIKRKRVFIWFSRFFIIILIFLSAARLNLRTPVYAETSVYDFIAHAGEASWSSGAGSLPFPGSDDDSRGFALYRYNWILEDGSKKARVLETHPQWVIGGYIMGTYPKQVIPENARLRVKIGFLHGATHTDGAIFEVKFMDEKQRITTILRHHILYDGKLDLFIEDLSPLAGKKGNFILYVSAGKLSSQDWVAWVEAKIEVPQLPDLTVTEIWKEGDMIHYKMKNIGDVSIGSSSNPATIDSILFVDGGKVATDRYIGTIGVNQEVERSFSYHWEASLSEHTIKVCADWKQAINEKDEGNNCREEVWHSLPDLTITSMDYSPKTPRVGDEVSLTIAIANLGNFTSKPCKGALLVGKVLYVLTDLPSLLPQETKEISLTWIPASEGMQELSFYVDYKETIEEFNENNNQFTIKVNVLLGIIKKPDLKAVEIEWTPEVIIAEEEVDLKPIVYNIGDSPSPSCVGEFKVNGTTIGSVNIPSIPVGGSLEDVADISLSWTPADNGTYEISFLVDADDEVDESNETNNEVTVSVKVFPRITQPPARAIRCYISGYIEGFTYDLETLKVELCEAERSCGYKLDPTTHERRWECEEHCKPDGRIWRVDVQPTEVFRKYFYRSVVDPRGVYLVKPVYQPCEEEGCEYMCEWKGRWVPEAHFIRMEGAGQSVDFVFEPLGLNPPSVSIYFSNDNPSTNEDVEITVNARDDKGIKKVFIKIDEIYWNGRVVEGPWREISFTSRYDPSSKTYEATAREMFTENYVRRIIVNAMSCDVEGNRAPASPRILSFECPTGLNVHFTAYGGGRLVTSDLSMFGWPDRDGDGLNDCWEDIMMRGVAPYIELDDEEDLEDHPGDHVVTFVRVTPYPNKENPTHILFYYVVTWSADYGRFTFEDHPGDTEPVIMAWRIVDDYTISLEYVHIYAHGGCNKRDDLWSAYGVSCNEAEICDFSSDPVPWKEETCGELKFLNNRLHLYASEDKHALYPTCQACESVTLVTPWSYAGFDALHFDSWEDFGKSLLDAVFGVANFITRVLVEVVSSIVDLLTWWKDDHLGDEVVTLNYARLRDTTGLQTLDYKGKNFHYILYWHVENFRFPHVRVMLDRLYCEKEDLDGPTRRWYSTEPYLVIAGFSIDPEGVDTWVPEPIPPVGDDVDSGEWDEDFPVIVVFDGEVTPYTMIGFSASLFEDDGPDTSESDRRSKANDIADELRSRLTHVEWMGECGETVIERLFYHEVGEDCAGGDLIQPTLYNVGEPDSIEHLFLNDLGGEPLAPQDQFPGNSLIGIELTCDGKTAYKFCGHPTSSCSCATSILEWMKIPDRDSLPPDVEGKGLPENLEIALQS